jgi:aspartate-semialdehyde dehydrogenase
MSAQKRFKLALVGTDSLRAREVKSVLGRKRFRAFDLEFFDPGVEEDYSKLTEFKKEPKVVHGIADERLSDKDLVFLAADAETNLALGRRAAKLGFRAVDLGDAVSSREDVPLVVAGINDSGPELAGAFVVANPHPLAIIVAHVLHPIRAKLGLAKAVAFALREGLVANEGRAP